MVFSILNSVVDKDSSVTTKIKSISAISPV